MIHRGGLLGGILGGALLGLAIYVINYYTFSFFFPWMHAISNTLLIVTHVLFGAMAGGIYEALEVEEFFPAKETEEENGNDVPV